MTIAVKPVTLENLEDEMAYFNRRKTVAMEVYVPDPNPDWPSHIQFPTGSKEFYERFGFELKRRLPKQKGYLYRLVLHH